VIATFNDYQNAAQRTSAAPWPERERPLVQCLGLCGEAGEVANIIKKAAWHGQPADREKLADEMGDCLWYLADLASHYGLTLRDIAQRNVDKLQARYPDGFVLGGGNR
jgi:NTP pyrophosphatase (non-canonical NTP hydrolase)